MMVSFSGNVIVVSLYLRLETIKFPKQDCPSFFPDNQIISENSRIRFISSGRLSICSCST